MGVAQQITPPFLPLLMRIGQVEEGLRLVGEALVIADKGDRRYEAELHLGAAACRQDTS